jgi:hypothetical protein
MFSIDPVSGNSLGFEPNKLLTPKDAFEVRVGVPALQLQLLSSSLLPVVEK